MLRTGIDIFEIERIKKVLSKKYAERFLRKIYTAKELELYRNNIPELAARWSGKEAASKMLGVGLLPGSPIKWQEIEILPNRRGKPELYLYGNAKKIQFVLSISEIDVSFSHTKKLVVASVTGIGMSA